MEHQNQNVVAAERIIFLDYLRIFAFASVLIGHKLYGHVVALANDTAAHATPRLIAELSMPLLFGGGAGVIVFFLVSGYIITHVLQTETAGEFLIKRAFRIYPLYIVAVLLEAVPPMISGRPPELVTLISQLLLVGDLVGNYSYALNGVEWTLRLEVLFYVFMAGLRKLGIISVYRRTLPYVFIATTLLCAYLAPIPSANIWTKGFVTIYFPFLLLGSMFYLFEKKQFGLTLLLIFTGLTLSHYFGLTALYQSRWMHLHYGMLAFLIFFGGWLWRNHLTAPPWILFLSDMTYAVYLFHNWFFAHAQVALAAFMLPMPHLDVQALIVLLIVCAFMVRNVEKPGIRLGRRVLKRY